MNAGTVGLVAGLAGFFLGGYAVFVATTAQRDVAGVQDVVVQDQESMDGLADQFKELRQSVQGAHKGIGDVRGDEQQLRATVAGLIERLDAAEAELANRRGGRAAPPVNVDVGAAARDAAKRFEELRAKVFGGTATSDEEAEFWKLARTTGAVDDLIATLEKEIAQNPRDVEAAFRLANAYTAKLLTVPDGPERGAWAGKGENVYRGILKEFPDNWDARAALAFSLSQWPAFMPAKGTEAIEQFEKLRRMQSGLTPETKHARTYLQLAELYRSKGSLDKAREVLQDGAERHPDDEAIRNALGMLDE